MSIFNWFTENDLLVKVILTVFKKLPNGIDGSGIGFAWDGPISAQNLLNAFAISSSSVFILLSILNLWGKLELVQCFALQNYFFHENPVSEIISELENFFSGVFFFGFTLNGNK